MEQFSDKPNVSRTHSFFASLAGDVSSQQELLPYRLRTIRIGIQATAFAAIVLTIFFVLPGRGPIHEPTYWTVLAFTLGGAVLVHLLPWRALFERGLGIAFMFAWS